MKHLLWILAALLVLCTAVVPALHAFGVLNISWISASTLAALNFIGWAVVFMGILWFQRIRGILERSFRKLGFTASFRSIDDLVSRLGSETERKSQAISVDIIERSIHSREDLSRALEKLVQKSMTLLDAESAELALFDKETGMYLSSFVMGKPFRSSAQAMLSGAAEGKEGAVSPDVLVQPIAFAGSVLGSLRVALKAGRLPSPVDREIMNVLALQSGMAIINAQYTDQLLRMRVASEESVKAKTGFLANLSHEIRGPLGIMINAVELVLDGLCGPVSADQVETLQMIQSNGQHLLELINDVLDYAKIESGKISTSPVEVIVQDIVKDLSGVVRKQAESKSHELIMRETKEALAIRCDRRHLRQSIINLLTNAIKYTPDGGRIEFWAERVPGNKVRISVKDTGVGIDPSARAKVFSAFERVEDSYSLRQIGTGLGMSLTKKLVEVNGGQIDFESEPGQGTHFWIVFPSAEVEAARAQARLEPQVAVDGRGDLVLLVQKDEGERKMIGRYLIHLGFSVDFAQTRREALESIEQGRVRIVVIDNDVVDDPSVDVIDAIRDTAKASALPVIIISSRAFIFDVEKYLRAGIDRCLFKPVEIKELARTCRELIDGSYTGDVVDREELDMAHGETAALEQTSEGKTENSPVSRGKLLGVDDIVH